jgi:SAM-dependent methyltransferase
LFTKSQAFYEAIYDARGKDYAAEAAWLRAAIGVANPGAKRVLDVACGTGAHLRFLHRHFEVAGEDADAAMIAIAKERLPGVPLRVGRMQDLAVEEPFDALMCLFGSIGYVAGDAELRTTIARFAAAVRTGGLVIVEPWLHPEDWREGTLEASFVDQAGLKIARIGTNERYGATAVIRYEYLVGEATGVSGFSETHRLQLFEDAQYRAAFEAAGLKPRNERSDLFSRGLYVATKQ